MTFGTGSPDRVLSETEIKSIIKSTLPAAMIRDKGVLVLTPDATGPARCPY